MKLSMNLGVPTQAMLKHPTTCFNLSRALTRISDSLAFGLFYVNGAKFDTMLPREIEHVSSSVHGSAVAAKLLSTMVEEASLKEEIEAYVRSADRFNNGIRQQLREKIKAFEESSKKHLKDARGHLKAAKTGVPYKKKGNTPVVSEELVSAQRMKEGLEKLRSKVDKIENGVEDLCTVRPKESPAPVTERAPKGFRPRVGMAGSAPRKRPIYPRYFVASMGRSRR